VLKINDKKKKKRSRNQDGGRKQQEGDQEKTNGFPRQLGEKTPTKKPGLLEPPECVTAKQ